MGRMRGRPAPARRGGWPAAAALALALAGVGGGAWAGPVRSLLEMRRDRVVVQEYDLSCGAAALATILNHQHGDPIAERQIALGLIGQTRYVENPELVRIRHGFSLLDLKVFVESRGYTGIGFGGLDLEDLVKKAPIMVPIRTSGYNHFVVFRGMFRDRVLLADPAFGNRTMTKQRFSKVWMNYGKIGHVGFIVGRNGAQSGPGALAARASDFPALR